MFSGTSCLPKFSFCSICRVTIDNVEQHDAAVDMSCTDLVEDVMEATLSAGEAFADLKLWDRDFLALWYVDSLLKML